MLSVVRREVMASVLLDQRSGRPIDQDDPEYTPSLIVDYIPKIGEFAERVSARFLQLAREQQPDFMPSMAIESAFKTMGNVIIECAGAYHNFCLETGHEYSEDTLVEALGNPRTKRLLSTLARMSFRENRFFEQEIGLRARNYGLDPGFIYDPETGCFLFNPVVVQRTRFGALVARMDDLEQIEDGDTTGCPFVTYIPAVYDRMLKACHEERLLATPSTLYETTA